MKICKINILIFLVALISLNLNSAFSYEEENEIQGEDIVVCAQVLPCDEEGNVLEEYRGELVKSNMLENAPYTS